MHTNFSKLGELRAENFWVYGSFKKVSVAVALLNFLILHPLLRNFLLIETATATLLPFLESAGCEVAD